MWDQLSKKDADTRKFEGIDVKLAAESIAKASQQQNSGDKK
jgi:hypothetical protein